MKKTIVAIIPARGGSKSIPYKNIKIFAGKPLIYWVTKAAQDSSIIKKIIIATDSKKIKDIVNTFNFKKVFITGRSKSSSTDSASSETVLIEISKKFDFDNLIFLQVTNPFLRAPDIDGAYNLYKKQRYDSVLSAAPNKSFIWQKQKKRAYAVNYDYKNRPIRQDFKKFFIENGALYITSRYNLLKYRNRLSGKIGIYIMPVYSYFELDEPEDWEIVEAIFLRKKLYLKAGFNLNKIKLLALDIDGVLTDGSIYYSKKGERLFKFSRIDGKGIEIFLKSNRKIFVISSEDSKISKSRLEKVKIKDYLLGASNKWNALKKYLAKNNIMPKETAFIGDDIQDLEVIKKIGFSACPLNAIEDIKNKVDYVCSRKGGNGAVREVIDLIVADKSNL